ncbi:MAG: CPBP family intramembrane metalloprotease [Chitinophagaceae bacterium]|nr:MAG: CPBP family intramembrane metalloprotease [Chitinophagaceae bacterium]
MKSLFGALRSYQTAASAPALVAGALFTALLVFINYHFRVEPRITSLHVGWRLLAWFGVYAFAFWTAYGLSGLGIRKIPLTPALGVLLLVAPAFFALKIALPLPVIESDYWHTIVYYPYKLLLVATLLYLVWKRYHSDEPFYGTGRSSFGMKPYIGMLLFMLPLIALASAQKDFLAMYPKWQHIDAVRASGPNGQLLYELSYGSDFITIELFFRGFLIIAFARYVGAAAVLPMAVFYCTIHFGKPLGECISSFFGGLLLGAVTLHTRSIWGGLMVHLGIAWLMELGGALGHQLRPELFY